MPDSFTSAFGAVATTARSRSRTTMSRIRTAILIRPARSICVPPTSTVLPWPILSSMAAASHGVATSRLIGPAPSRHHSPPKQLTKITASTAITTASALDPASADQPPLQRCELVAEPIKSGTGTGQQPTRAGARRLVVLLVPAGRIIPMRDLSLGTRIRPLGRSIPSHCLSVLAVRLIAVKDAPIDRYRALLCRHRCQSSINTVTRGRAQGLIGCPRKRADGWCVEILVTILRGHQTCPAAGANPTIRDKIRNTLMVDPRKATKGRRMSKKTRKKSSKAPPGKSGRTSAAKPSAAKTARGSKATAKKPRKAGKTRPARPKAGKAAAKGAGKKPAQAPKTASAKASHKAPSKSLKSNPSAPAKATLQPPPRRVVRRFPRRA